MVLPTSIQIAGEPWKIFREADAPARLKHKHKSLYARGIYGETHFDTREIVIAGGLTPHQEFETLCHELLHACYHVTKDEHLGPELEERIIEALDEYLACVILQLIQFNTIPQSGTLPQSDTPTQNNTPNKPKRKGKK